MEALVEGMKTHLGEEFGLHQLKVKRRFKAICSRSLRELTSEDGDSRYSLLCEMLRSLKAGKTCNIEDFQNIWNSLKAVDPALPEFGIIEANQNLQAILSEQVEAAVAARAAATAARMCTSSSSQMKTAPTPVPALSKEQLAEVEYIIQLEKAHHDKIMDDKLLAHGKWLDNKMDNWMARFQEVWVEAAYNKAVLFEELKNDVTNKKLGTLQYALALSVGTVGATVSIAS